MSFQKFTTDSFCVGGRHQFATTKFFGDITSKGSKVLVSYCSICNRKKSMTVPDNTIKAEKLGSFLKNLGRVSAKAGRKLTTNVLRNPGGALETTSNLATASATKNQKAALPSVLELISFYHTGNGLYLGNFV